MRVYVCVCMGVIIWHYVMIIHVDIQYYSLFQTFRQSTK